MSLVLLESSMPTWVAGAVMLTAMVIALIAVMNYGNSRPHS